MAIFLRDWFSSLTGWTNVGNVFSDGERLNLDSVADAACSAKRNILPTSNEFLVEVDIEYSLDAGFTGYVELLDASNNPVVWFYVNGGNVTVDTDGDTASSVGMGHSARRHLVIAVDRVNNQARFFLAGAEPLSGPYTGWSQIGATKAYSGAAITQVQFRTSTTGQMYADQLHIYSPDYFIIGDSISDGKELWSVKPDYRWEYTGGNPSTPPHYKLEQLLGAGTNYVADRGFGGAKSGDVDTWIQSSVIDQYAKRCIIHVGVNDINAGAVSLATLKSNIESVIGQLQAGGITGENIILCKIAPSSWFNGTPANDEADRLAYNVWIYNKACEIGARLVLNSEALNDNTRLVEYKRIKAAYTSGGTHLTEAGNTVFAGAIHASRPPGGVLRPASTDLFPASYLGNYTVVAGATHELAGNASMQLTAAGNLTTGIRLAGNASMSMTGTGVLNSGAVLQGAARITLTSSANLSTSAITMQTLLDAILTRLAAVDFIAPDNSGIAANGAAITAMQEDVNSLITYAISMSKWKNNKLARASVVGTVETWVLYDDDNTTPLLTWTHDTSTKVRGKAI